MSSGQDRAWDILCGLEPGDVRESAYVRHEEGSYILTSLGMEFSISPSERVITGTTREARLFLGKFAYFYNHAAIWYLVGARDATPSGRLLRPEDLKDGLIFFTGTHKLPLQDMAEKYGHDQQGFMLQAAALGGTPLDLGDASALLHPFPKIPVTLILWLGDEEFAPRADLLMDSTAGIHMPIDITWSTAMFSLAAML
jgi:hypothetical protein